MLLRESTAAAVAESPLVVALIDLPTMRIVCISAGAEAALGIPASAAAGRPVSDWVEDAPSGLPLLATGRLDGFEAGRRILRPDGPAIAVHIWAHVLGATRPARHAIAIGAIEPPGEPSFAAVEAEHKVIGTVDSEWRIDRISLEVESLLGYQPADLADAPVLSAIHPNDLGGLLTGVAQVRDTGRNAALRLRLRTASGSWLLCRARIAPLGDTPGFAFTLRAWPGPATAVDPDQDIRQLLERIAHEVRVAAMSMSPGNSPTLSEMPRLALLSSREWEVVTRLGAGARVATIGKEFGITASTVRNHLSSIFRKLEVRSQAELLERLQQRTGSPVPRQGR